MYVFPVLRFYLKGAFVMDKKEFVEAIINTDEKTLLTVCQLLGADQQPFEFPGLPPGTTHIAS